jgi:SAM-dependent methyltransferase
VSFEQCELEAGDLSSGSKEQLEAAEELWDGFWHDDVPVAQEVAWRVHETEIMPLIERYFSLEGEILDAGCGRGGMLIYLFRRGYPMRGCDVSQRNLDMINDFDPGVPLDREDILALTYDDERFDGMFSYGVMEHFSAGPAHALEEARRVLKPGAVLLVSVPYTTGFRKIVSWARDNATIRRLLRKPPRAEMADEEIPELAFRRSEFASHVERAGFEIVTSKPIFTKNHAAHMSRLFRSSDYPDSPTYGTILDPPLSPLGKAVHRVASWIAPWSMAHFQFVVARRL